MFLIELPSPKDMRSQRAKLITCRTFMARRIHTCVPSYEKYSKAMTCSTFILIQIRKFLMVANMKNSSKTK